MKLVSGLCLLALAVVFVESCRYSQLQAQQKKLNAQTTKGQGARGRRIRKIQIQIPVSVDNATTEMRDNLKLMLKLRPFARNVDRFSETFKAQFSAYSVKIQVSVSVISTNGWGFENDAAAQALLTARAGRGNCMTTTANLASSVTEMSQSTESTCDAVAAGNSTDELLTTVEESIDAVVSIVSIEVSTVVSTNGTVAGGSTTVSKSSGKRELRLGVVALRKYFLLTFRNDKAKRKEMVASCRYMMKTLSTCATTDSTLINSFYAIHLQMKEFKKSVKAKDVKNDSPSAAVQTACGSLASVIQTSLNVIMTFDFSAIVVKTTVLTRFVSKGIAISATSFTAYITSVVSIVYDCSVSISNGGSFSAAITLVSISITSLGSVATSGTTAVPVNGATTSGSGDGGSGSGNEGSLLTCMEDLEWLMMSIFDGSADADQATIDSMAEISANLVALITAYDLDVPTSSAASLAVYELNAIFVEIRANYDVLFANVGVSASSEMLVYMERFSVGLTSVFNVLTFSADLNWAAYGFTSVNVFRNVLFESFDMGMFCLDAVSSGLSLSVLMASITVSVNQLTVIIEYGIEPSANITYGYEYDTGSGAGLYIFAWAQPMSSCADECISWGATVNFLNYTAEYTFDDIIDILNGTGILDPEGCIDAGNSSAVNSSDAVPLWDLPEDACVGMDPAELAGDPVDDGATLDVNLRRLCRCQYDPDDPRLYEYIKRK